MVYSISVLNSQLSLWGS